MNQEQFEDYQAQESLQRQQIEGQQVMYAPQMAEQVQQTQAVLVEQTNPKKIVENIMLRLRGKRKLDNGSEEKIGEPKMNEKGIEAIWFILDSHINQNIIYSRLDIHQISQIMESISDDLVDDLALNWKRYEIKNKTDLDVINNSILVNIYLALKRAEGQNEKNWVGKISIENISGGGSIQKPKSEGFWSKFRL